VGGPAQVEAGLLLLLLLPGVVLHLLILLLWGCLLAVRVENEFKGVARYFVGPPEDVQGAVSIGGLLVVKEIGPVAGQVPVAGFQRGHGA